MNDPRVSAVLCTLFALWLGYTIFAATVPPSPILLAVQWALFLFALFGAVEAIVRIVRNRGR